MHSLYVFDSSAQRSAKDYVAQIKASTEKEPLSQLFSMFKRETTVSLPKHCEQPAVHSMPLCPVLPVTFNLQSSVCDSTEAQ